MKRIWLYLLILISPFSFIVLINETVSDGVNHRIKSNILGEGGIYNALNSEKELSDSCTWYCHNSGCDSIKHTKNISKGFVKKLYFNIIEFNKHKTLNYASMNVILFVFVVPFFVYVLIILNIEVYLRNKKNRQL